MIRKGDSSCVSRWVGWGGIGGGASFNESTIRGVEFQPLSKSLNLARLTVLMQFKKKYIYFCADLTVADALSTKTHGSRFNLRLPYIILNLDLL